MPFLLLTFLVYAIIPESNLHRKALMNYVLTLLLAYIFLVTVQLYPGKFNEVMCPLLGKNTVDLHQLSHTLYIIRIITLFVILKD